MANDCTAGVCAWYSTDGRGQATGADMLAPIRNVKLSPQVYLGTAAAGSRNDRTPLAGWTCYAALVLRGVPASMSPFPNAIGRPQSNLIELPA